MTSSDGCASGYHRQYCSRRKVNHIEMSIIIPLPSACPLAVVPNVKESSGKHSSFSSRTTSSSSSFQSLVVSHAFSNSMSSARVSVPVTSFGAALVGTPDVGMGRTHRFWRRSLC